MSRRFDGTQYLKSTSTTLTSGPLSMSVWCYPENITDGHIAFAIGDDTGAGSGYERVFLNFAGHLAGDPLRLVSQNSVGGGNIADTTTAFVANKWQHAGCKIDADGKCNGIFLDGGGKGVATGNVLVQGNFNHISIGCNYSGVTGGTPIGLTTGSVGECAIWNVELDDNDFLLLAQGMSPLLIKPENLVNYYLVGGEDSPEIDMIGGRSAALVGLPVQGDSHPPVIHPFVNQPIDGTLLAAVLSVQSLNHSHSIDNINLVQANVLTLNELNHSQALDNVTVNQSINLAVQELAHALSMDNPALVQANVIIVQELLHNHLIDTPALTQANTLAPDPLDHQQLLDNVVLSSAGVLAVDELSHLFSMDSPVLTQANVLTVQGSDHSQSLDNIDLLSGVSLIVSRLDQAQAIDNVALTQSHFLEIQDAVHAVLFDSPALNQSNVLSVDELNHSQLIDSVALTQASTLIVSDILHAHFLDNIDFATGIIRTQNERVFIVKRKERTFIIAKPYRDNLQ